MDKADSSTPLSELFTTWFEDHAVGQHWTADKAHKAYSKYKDFFHQSIEEDIDKQTYDSILKRLKIQTFRLANMGSPENQTLKKLLKLKDSYLNSKKVSDSADYNQHLAQYISFFQLVSTHYIYNEEYENLEKIIKVLDSGKLKKPKLQWIMIGATLIHHLENKGELPAKRTDLMAYMEDLNINHNLFEKVSSEYNISLTSKTPSLPAFHQALEHFGLNEAIAYYYKSGKKMHAAVKKTARKKSAKLVTTAKKKIAKCRAKIR